MLQQRGIHLHRGTHDQRIRRLQMVVSLPSICSGVTIVHRGSSQQRAMAEAEIFSAINNLHDDFGFLGRWNASGTKSATGSEAVHGSSAYA